MDFTKRYWVVTDGGVVVSSWDKFYHAKTDAKKATAQNPKCEYRVYRVDQILPHKT